MAQAEGLKVEVRVSELPAVRLLVWELAEYAERLDRRRDELVRSGDVVDKLEGAIGRMQSALRSGAGEREETAPGQTSWLAEEPSEEG